MKDTDKFREKVRLYQVWHSIDIKTVCFLAYGKWINMGTRIILSKNTATGPTNESMLPQIPNLCAMHEVRELEKLDQILDDIQTGKLTVSDKEIHFGAIEGNKLKISSPTLHLQHARSGTNYSQVEYPHVSLMHWGPALHNLLYNHDQAPSQDEIDWTLRSLTTPYDGLEDLLVNFLGTPRQAYGGSPLALVEVVAPFGIRLGKESRFSNGRLIVHVESISTQPPKGVSLGVIALSGITPVSQLGSQSAGVSS